MKTVSGVAALRALDGVGAGGRRLVTFLVLSHLLTRRRTPSGSTRGALLEIFGPLIGDLVIAASRRVALQQHGGMRGKTAEALATDIKKLAKG